MRRRAVRNNRRSWATDRQNVIAPVRTVAIDNFAMGGERHALRVELASKKTPYSDSVSASAITFRASAET